MKIAVFSAKGGVGKTPISTNIAFDRDYLIATNDEYHGFNVVQRVLEDDRLLVIAPNEEFPAIPDEMDVVFDLGGTLSGSSAPSIRSAIAQSDVVLVPVSNETKAIISAVATINEVKAINKNIVVIATKLKRGSKETGAHPWSQSKEFLNIADQISSMTDVEWPMFPLKLSAAFDAIFDQEKSLNELVAGGGADGFHYRMPREQFAAIYEHLKGYEKSWAKKIH